MLPPKKKEKWEKRRNKEKENRSILWEIINYYTLALAGSALPDPNGSPDTRLDDDDDDEEFDWSSAGTVVDDTM